MGGQNSRVVFVVAYGDDVHVYGEDGEKQAVILGTVGVAAFGDGGIYRVPADRWPAARERLRGEIAGRVIDYRK